MIPPALTAAACSRQHASANEAWIDAANPGGPPTASELQPVDRDVAGLLDHHRDVVETSPLEQAELEQVEAQFIDELGGASAVVRVVALAERSRAALRTSTQRQDSPPVRCRGATGLPLPLRASAGCRAAASEDCDTAGRRPPHVGHGRSVPRCFAVARLRPWPAGWSRWRRRQALELRFDTSGQRAAALPNHASCGRVRNRSVADDSAVSEPLPYRRPFAVDKRFIRVQQAGASVNR